MKANWRGNEEKEISRINDLTFSWNSHTMNDIAVRSFMIYYALIVPTVKQRLVRYL